MYFFSLVNILCYFFVLITSYFAIRGIIVMLKLGRTTGSRPVIVAVVFSPFSLWLFFQFAYLAVGYVPDRYFSKSAWNGNLHTRFGMSRHLVDGDLLIGKDTLAIKKMLGDPQIRSTVPDGSFQWQYQMGSSGFFMFHFLIVKGQNNQGISVIHVKSQD